MKPRRHPVCLALLALLALLAAYSAELLAPKIVSAEARVLSVTPLKAPVGATVILFGHVNPQSPYEVRWDYANARGPGILLASGQAPISGYVSIPVSIPPAFSDSTHTLNLLEGGVNGNRDWADITIIPSVRISKQEGPVGSTLTMDGSGFAQSETGVKVTWDGAELPGAKQANYFGSWSITFPAPRAWAGPHVVAAKGDVTTAGVAPVQFTVTPSIAADRLSGPTGTPVTVTGEGFLKNDQTIRILWDGAESETSISSDPSGEWSSIFTIPSSARGSHKLEVASSLPSAPDPAFISFEVAPSLSLSPAAGYPGMAVGISGTGFTGGGLVSIAYDGTQLSGPSGSVQSTPSGELNTVLIVPPGTSGIHKVMATDSAGPVEATFTMASSVSATPASGIAGSQIAVIGRNFPSNLPVNMTFDWVMTPTTPISSTTDGSGAFAFSFSVPSSPRGNHVIRVFSGSAAMEIPFDVSSSLSLSPATAAVGTMVTAHGAGFGAGEHITVTLGGHVLKDLASQVITASPSGDFVATFSVPATPEGNYAVAASAQGGSAQATERIIRSFAADASTVQKGDRVAIRGTGFASNAKVVMTIDGLATAVLPLLADANGSFSAILPVPALSFGNHVISPDGGISAVTVTVFPTFRILSAETGSPTLQISGTGFSANSPIAITYDGSPASAKPPPLSSGPGGDFQATVEVSRIIHGHHSVIVTDADGHSLQAQFDIESTPPPRPSLLWPASGSKNGFLSGSRLTFAWSAVKDLNAVTYNFQIFRDADLTQLVLETSDLAGASYTPKEAFGQGQYYWRVRAVDKAANTGEWSEVSSVRIVIPPQWIPGWIFVLGIVVTATIAILAARIAFFRNRSRRKA